jgi:signal transduction histidine kinase
MTGINPQASHHLLKIIDVSEWMIFGSNFLGVKMSIRGYLFLLFSALIFALGLGQVLMMDYVKSELQTQLQQSTKALSQDLIRVVIAKSKDEASEDIAFTHELETAQQTQEDRGRIDQMHNAILELEEDIRALSIDLAQGPQRTSDNTRGLTQTQKQQQLQDLHQRLSETVELLVTEETAKAQQHWELARMRAVAQKEYQQRVQQTLENINIDTGQWLNNGEVFISKDEGPMNILSRTHVPLGNQAAKAKLDEFGEFLFSVILATSLLAMLLTYWLAHHITRPLSALASGHQELGKGNFGIEIKPQGVKELKNILLGFNTMSQQLRHWRQQMTQMAEQQHLADLGQVAKGIAHSLRNPLHTLGLLSEQAMFATGAQQKEKINQQVQQKIALMDKNIQNLLALANDSVDRSKNLPLNEVIQDILLEVSMGHKQAFRFNLDSNNIVFPASGSEVRSILHAVIINAVEASPDDNPIHIACSQLGDYYCVKVSDSGQGIDEAIKKRLFEPHISTKSEGSGMGLYLAKRIISSHYGGDIVLESNPHGGTIVSVLFAKIDVQAKAHAQRKTEPQITSEDPL